MAPITHDIDESTAAVTTESTPSDAPHTRRAARRRSRHIPSGATPRPPLVLPQRRSGHTGLAVKLLLAGALAVATVAIMQENGVGGGRGPGAAPPEVIVELD